MPEQHVSRPVSASVDELLAGASERGPWDKNADSLSGSAFEYAVIDGERYVVKHIGHDIDWLMRALGDGVDGAPPWAMVMWRTGLLDALPACIDHATVGMAWDPATARLAVLMRDESSAFLPAGTGRIPLDQHHRLLDHMARMHARFWDFDDRYGLLGMAARYSVLIPAMSAREAAAGHDDPVPRAVPGGWQALRDAAPDAYEVALALATDPVPLVDALAGTPHTLIHGDWKAGNLGSHPDGRTVLVDWGWPGRAGPCVDLAWYLAVNCDRLPESKEDTAASLRGRLESHGIRTTGWWNRQLDLALVGGFLQLGWSKTGDPAELGWWTDRIVPVARDLLRQ
jgi:hypothetical protein